jgi:4-aminobutyrate aminotransferase-like enzyme
MAAVVTTPEIVRSLVGIEGANDNILKIRPPLVFSQANADQLIAALDRALESI